MSFGISKTIPQKEGIEALNKLYNKSISSFQFHMSGSPSKLKVGDYVFTTFNDLLYGKLKITSIKLNPNSTKKQSLITVKCPGILYKKPIPKKGHRGTRYYSEAK